jgi:hypothetical protein
MEGRARLVCGDCGRTCDVAGEMPGEYRAAFTRCVSDQGWAPRPGAHLVMICGVCLATYEGSETKDDAEKIGLQP